MYAPPLSRRDALIVKLGVRAHFAPRRPGKHAPIGFATYCFAGSYYHGYGCDDVQLALARNDVCRSYPALRGRMVPLTKHMPSHACNMR